MYLATLLAICFPRIRVLFIHEDIFMTDVRTSSLRSVVSVGLLTALTFGVLFVIFQPKVAFAAAGAGTATVRTAVSSGSDTAATATYGSPSGAGTVLVGSKTYMRVDLTVGAGGIVSAQNNVTMQVNLNLFPTSGWTTDTQTAVSDLDTVGEWAITYTDTSSTTDNTTVPISFAASASVNTGLLTIQADQQMDETDIIKVFMVVNDTNWQRSAASFVILVDDTGADDLAAIDAPITVATNRASADTLLVLAGNSVVGVSGNSTLTLTIPVEMGAGDTIEIELSPNLNATSVAWVSESFVGTGDFTCTMGSTSIRIICTADGTIDAAVDGTIVMSGIVSIFAATNQVLGSVILTDVGNGEIAFDSPMFVYVTDTTAAALTSTNVTLGGTRASTINTATVAFTTANSIATGGKIIVTFGSGFVVSGATGATCSTMNGNFATSFSGQVVTITRSTGSDGTTQTAGSESCTIGGIQNPSTAGSTGTYTISTSTSTDANIVDTDAAVSADNITSASSSSSSSSSTALTYAISLSAPVATAAYEGGDSIAVTWSTGASTGTVSAVNLAYSTDGGITYTLIVSGTSNDGSYSWTAPDIDAASVTIRAQGTDLITVLATDVSDAFSIGSEDESDDDSSDDGEDAEDVDTSEDSTTLLPEGTFFKGESWSTVYYVGADGTRRPFLDAQTFFTYADNFDGVIDASDDYLANYAIGAPMLPKAGTVLVKVVSVNNVYALEADNTLRWITSESIAISLYGSNWADFVIDVPVTAWGHFNFGDDVDSDSDMEVDDSILETRDALNSK